MKINELPKDHLISDVDTGTVLEFYSPMCVPCRNLLKQMETWNVKALFTIYKVNVEDHPELCERFNIRSVPTVVHYNVKYDLKNIDDLKRIICG